MIDPFVKILPRQSFALYGVHVLVISLTVISNFIGVTAWCGFVMFGVYTTSQRNRDYGQYVTKQAIPVSSGSLMILGFSIYPHPPFCRNFPWLRNMGNPDKLKLL